MTRVGRIAAAIAITLMMLTVAVWSRTTTSSDGADGTDLAADGAQLFQAKGCASCHDGPESSAAIGGFPPLVDATAWAGERRPGLSAADYLAESMRTPAAFISPAFSSAVGPTTAMPDLNLDESEIAALVTYLLR